MANNGVWWSWFLCQYRKVQINGTSFPWYLSVKQNLLKLSQNTNTQLVITIRHKVCNHSDKMRQGRGLEAPCGSSIELPLSEVGELLLSGCRRCCTHLGLYRVIFYIWKKMNLVKLKSKYTKIKFVDFQL